MTTDPAFRAALPGSRGREARWAAWIEEVGRVMPGDHACAECRPYSDILVNGFRCVYHEAAAFLGLATIKSSPAPMSGAELIAAERDRQLRPTSEGGEGWDANHDAGHGDELATAAACYALPPAHLTRYPSNGQVPPPIWPWAQRWWKPTPQDRVRELTKAGALIAAAIDAELAEPRP